MTTNPFGQPKPMANGPKTADIAGRLIILHVRGFKFDIATTHGKSDAMHCDLVDLTTGERHDDHLLFGKAMAQPQRYDVGTLYIGRIVKGEAKDGKNAPWILQHSEDPADIAAGVSYLETLKAQPVPVPQAAAPAPIPTPAPAAVAPAPAPPAPPWAQ